MKKHLAILTLGSLGFFALPALAADYVIDDAHASIHFKVNHLGYSWLTGRFNDFSGGFSYDPDNIEASSANVTISTNSIDSNHAERDKHLRSSDFLNTAKYPTATFVSTGVVKDDDDDEFDLIGDLTLNGVTRSITIDVEKIGEGEDPWGGHRAGFEGETSFMLKDFGIDKDLGPASQKVKLKLNLEGIRK